MIKSKAIIKKYGKSFFWASKFLDRQSIELIYPIYHLCREIDDMVDEGDSKIGLKNLKHIEENLSVDFLYQKFPYLEAIPKDQFPKMEYIQEFINGQFSDLKFQQPKDMDDLIKYCYRVAGVVGLMLCDVLNIEDKKLKLYAIDLGIGMQLVNIARDIKEDAENERIYLPQSLIGEQHHKNIIENLDLQDLVNLKRNNLIEISSSYFRSSDKAFEFLPKQIGYTFRLASILYEGIGVKLLTENHHFMHGRAYLSKFEKLKLTLFSLFERHPKLDQLPKHNKKLHIGINKLPDTDNGIL